MLIKSLLVSSYHTSCTYLSFFVSVPKVDQINHRLGPLAQEFKDLAYPAHYNPESKPAAKRKTGQSCKGYLLISTDDFAIHR